MSLRNAGRVAVACFIGLAGYVHYRIWKPEYRHAPVREMFVANWVPSTVVAFVLSRGRGLPTLHGTFKETGLETTSEYVFHLGSAKVILVSEAIAAVLSGVLLLPRRRISG